ncbi:MAG TPA: hypothetical protein VJT13_00485 [Xanthobacteraceae bacterium]|nr:hypothetical protein [Xanthobacteraceae bacterium]
MRFLLAASVTLASLTAAQAGTIVTRSYNDPFSFGMTREQVERLAQAPLIYLSGPRGSERYLIKRLSTVPGFYPVDTSIVLQFRRGRLTGWRRDWQMRPWWF